MGSGSAAATVAWVLEQCSTQSLTNIPGTELLGQQLAMGLSGGFIAASNGQRSLNGIF